MPGLEIEFMFKQVTADVLAATQGKQQPERWSRLQAVLVLAPGKTAVPPVPQPADACDGLLVSVAMGQKPCIKPGTGESFRDCADCPEMVIAPSGSFTMGSPGSEPETYYDENPQHTARIPKPFAVGKFAVSFAEWDACTAACACNDHRPGDEGWGRGALPVINVNWNDAKAYVTWLSKKTGKSYRLLSEAEREYAARAGTETAFWWGQSITPEQANYDGSAAPYMGGGKKGKYREKTVPVQSFEPNPWGLYQVHGNVSEWVEDCWHDDYKDAPGNGSWISGDCTSRVLRGGSWESHPRDLRAAFRFGYIAGTRLNAFGFRLARTLEP